MSARICKCADGGAAAKNGEVCVGKGGDAPGAHSRA